MAAYDEWFEAFGDAYDAVPERTATACPRCGHRRLRLVFTGEPGGNSGYAQFWCEHCLHGIVTSRTGIPDGAELRDIRLPVEERVPRVPHFELVEGS